MWVLSVSLTHRYLDFIRVFGSLTAENESRRQIICVYVLDALAFSAEVEIPLNV